ARPLAPVAGRPRLPGAWLRLVARGGAGDAGVRLVHGDRQPHPQRGPGPPVPRRGRPAFGGAVPGGRAPGRSTVVPRGRRGALVARAAARLARSPGDGLGRPGPLGGGRPRADGALAIPATPLRPSRLFCAR